MPVPVRIADVNPHPQDQFEYLHRQEEAPLADRCIQILSERVVIASLTNNYLITGISIGAIFMAILVSDKLGAESLLDISLSLLTALILDIAVFATLHDS
jgi:hypothetical protein